MVRAHEVFARELVEPRREAFGEPARVGEHERGAVRADQLEQAGLHVGPDARARLGARPDAPRSATPEGNGP